MEVAHHHHLGPCEFWFLGLTGPEISTSDLKKPLDPRQLKLFLLVDQVISPLFVKKNREKKIQNGIFIGFYLYSSQAISLLTWRWDQLTSTCTQAELVGGTYARVLRSYWHTVEWLPTLLVGPSTSITTILAILTHMLVFLLRHHRNFTIHGKPLWPRSALPFLILSLNFILSFAYCRDCLCTFFLLILR